MGAVLAALLHAPLASSAPAPRASRELFASHAARDSARAAWIRERWSGSLASLRLAQARLDRATERYDAALAQSPLPSSISIRDRAAWIDIAMDLAQRSAWSRARALLRGPLRSPSETLPVEALAAGSAGSPDSGLRVLDWRTDRTPRGSRSMDEAGLFVAAALSDSTRVSKSSRSARWLLLDARRPATARTWARTSLARSLATGGEPLLARELLARAPSRSTAETLLLADLTVAAGDTLAAARPLVANATRSDLATADRYAAAKKAAGWVQGPAAEALSDKEWMGLVRALADVGEATLALRVLDARKRPADLAGTVEREELRASLLYRARRYDAAAAAYRGLLAKPRRPGASRADEALGLARSLRAQRLFVPSDSAFVLATRADTAGTVRETAAWERAREWEDLKTPREAAVVLHWARAQIRTEPNATTARVHEAIQWIRGDSLAAADSVLTGPGPEDARIFFWRGWVASARGDSVRSREAYRRAWETDPWSYEGVRARELSGLPIDAAQGTPEARPRHGVRHTAPPPFQARVLDVVGFRDLALETLRSCATGEAEPRANGCIDALEDEGLYRVGRADLNLDLRLRFPPASAGPVFRASEEESLGAPFIWSIMRQESGYNPTARSRAGALGLLQLIVPTASRLAGRPVTESALLDPDLNVRLGAMYLRQLVREFGDLRPVAAAYNSGEDAVRRWIAARPRVDDLWVELIPYWETRGYVKQTYAAMRRYEAVYEAILAR